MCGRETKGCARCVFVGVFVGRAFVRVRADACACGVSQTCVVCVHDHNIDPQRVRRGGGNERAEKIKTVVSVFLFVFLPHSCTVLEMDASPANYGAGGVRVCVGAQVHVCAG